MPITGKSTLNRESATRESALPRGFVLRLREMPDISDFPMGAQQGEDRSIHLDLQYTHAATCAIPDYPPRYAAGRLDGLTGRRLPS